eukprot:163600_1
MDTKQELVLKHHNVINGIVPVQIVNLNEFEKPENDMMDYEFEIKYKFIFKHAHANDSKNYTHNAWITTTFDIESITQADEFWFKAPSFLLSYTLQYDLSLNITTFAETENGICIGSVSTIKSTTQSIEIPSILIETTYEVNETIQYFPEANPGYTWPGTILELLENNQIKIKPNEVTNENYTWVKNADIITIDPSEVLRNCIHAYFIVDLTNNTNAILDLILRTNDARIRTIYSTLNAYLFQFYYFEMMEIEEHDNFKSILSLVSSHICEFLCKYDYNYRVMCMLNDEHDLFVQQIWQYAVLKQFNDIKNGLPTADIQDFSGTGYSCSICRCELSRYEFMFFCPNSRHGYCVSCMYSFILQHNEMKIFLYECLDELLNEDCIEQVVTFCVGKVIKYN